MPLTTTASPERYRELAVSGAIQFEQRVLVLDFIDARLAEGQTDGWRYEDMPECGQARRESSG